MTNEQIIQLAVQVVSAYCERNTANPATVGDMLDEIHARLTVLNNPAPAVPEVVVPQPAVAPKKSIFPDFLVCLEDGAHVKMLRRYLMSRFNLTPDQYRAKWGLPSDYPMVAPNYAKKRSALAKEFGLGAKRKAFTVAA